jgi:hypothetical protein
MNSPVSLAWVPGHTVLVPAALIRDIRRGCQASRVLPDADASMKAVRDEADASTST